MDLDPSKTEGGFQMLAARQAPLLVFQIFKDPFLELYRSELSRSEEKIKPHHKGSANRSW